MRISSTVRTKLLRWGPWALIFAVMAYVLWDIVLTRTAPFRFVDYWWPVVGLSIAAVLHHVSNLDLADEVIDQGHNLIVRKGARAFELAFSEIDEVVQPQYATPRIQEIVIKLRSRSPLGTRVRFLPANQSLQGSYSRVGVLKSLQLKVQRARENAA